MDIPPSESPANPEKGSMKEVFKSFCSFGQKGAGAPMMDGAKLAKLTRDCKLLDKNLTSISVDIIFSSVKEKHERKISYKQFTAALKLMAEKKYPNDENGFPKLKEAILSAEGPSTSGATKLVKNAAVDRLTDTSKYTGSHKQRFSSDGRGKGIAGRREETNKSGYTQGFRNASPNPARKSQSLS